MSNKTWTKEQCRETAKMCKTRKRFRQLFPEIYRASALEHWIEEFDWLQGLHDEKWTMLLCKDEARRYKYIEEFESACPELYNLSVENGWLVDYKWLKERPEPVVKEKPAPEWPYERCMEEALKYKTKADFRTMSPKAYGSANRHKWLKEYVWLATAKRITKAECAEIAHKYDTIQEFELIDNKAYSIALKRGWLKTYDWLTDASLPGASLGGWTYERCYAEARKYKFKTDFEIHSRAAFRAARSSGWIGDYVWFLPIKQLTREMCLKESQRYHTWKEFSTECYKVYKAAINNGWTSEMVWLSDNAYWTYERCLAEAMQYQRLREFREKSPLAFKAARSHGWLKTLYRNGILAADMWTHESCLEEARKHRSKSAFMEKSPSAWRAAQQNNWTDLLEWEDSIYWTRERCLEAAKKYKKLSDLAKAHSGAVAAARKNGWLSDYTWLAVSRAHIWTREECEAEAKKYPDKRQFRLNSNRAYNAAERKGWLGLWFKEPQKQDFSTYEACFKEAMKYTKLSDFRKHCVRAQRIAAVRKWQKDYYWLEGNVVAQREWSDEKCYQEALKCKSQEEFQQSSPIAYGMAKQKGWLDEYDWSKDGLGYTPGYTYEKCYKEAQKYTRLIDFHYGSQEAYKVSREKGWIDSFTWLDKGTRRTGKWDYESCRREAMKYEWAVDFSKKSYGAYQRAYREGWLKDFTWLKKQRKRANG